jgi:NADH dehydrogenase FAD-containing subunit/uncharacterized membrane protein YphA (DoxX/SURF4 family)
MYFGSTATAARVRISLRLWIAGYEAYKSIFHPIIDLTIRLSVAQVFFYSGLVKALNGQNELHFSRLDHPIGWMRLEHVSVFGVIIELVCPLLLAFGLFTRPAALVMGILAVVIQVNHQSTDANVIWAAILFNYVMFGARAFSLDALISPGLADSALPVLPRLIKITKDFDARMGSAMRLLLRLWLGWAFMQLPAPATMFPETTVQNLLPSPMAFIGGIMLTLGLAATGINKLLAVAAFGMQMMAANEANGPWLILLLAQFGTIGSGFWSCDRILNDRLVRWMKPSHGVQRTDDWPRVIIIGAGFGGLACAAKLRHLPVHLTVIDQHNYHLFQPLLYQVATAALSPSDIASPIRSQFRDDPNVSVIMETVTGVDTKRQTVTAGEQVLAYDLLVIATGALPSYFGHDDWVKFAPSLKQVDDATTVRAKLLAAFERAENATNKAERKAYLTFVVVGGGPTGVELAGAIAELAQFGLREEFRLIDPAAARIILVQAASRLLPSFPEPLSARACVSLEKLGIEIRLNSRVEKIDEEGVTIDGHSLQAKTVLWAAGVVASEASNWLKAKTDRLGRIYVDEFLRLPTDNKIFVIGDTAVVLDPNGQQVPGLASAAKQGGDYVAKVVRAKLRMRPAPPPFAYRHKGSLATIGRRSAVADFGRLRLWGAPAWWLWGAVHILFLSGLRNRHSVIVSWIWAYLTLRNHSRLITGQKMQNKQAKQV